MKIKLRKKKTNWSKFFV